MNTQHTPGPWWNMASDGSVCIGNTHASEVRRRYEVHPDLLAALRALVAQHDKPHGFDDEHWYAPEIAAARAAIAKAEGK